MSGKPFEALRESEARCADQLVPSRTTSSRRADTRGCSMAAKQRRLKGPVVSKHAPHKKTPKTCKRSPERVSPKKGVPAKGVPNKLKSFPLESKGYPHQNSSGLETGMNMACPRNGRRSPVGCPEKNNAFCHACVGTIAKKARGGSGRFKRCLQTKSEFAIFFRQTTNFRGL